MVDMNEHDKGDKWDEADIAELKRLYVDQGWSAVYTALRLGRTVSGVRGKLFRLGIKHTTQFGTAS